MILSKTNLLVHKAAMVGGRRSLQCVRIERDGSTVASNGEMIVAVEPSNPEVRFPSESIIQAEVGKDGLLLPSGMFAKAIKNLSKDKRLGLQHVAIARSRDPGKLDIVSIDPAGNSSVVEGSPILLTYPEWKQSFRTKTSSMNITRICVNRKAILEMLKLVDEMSPGTGNIFLEIDPLEGKLVSRSINGLTHQRVLAACPTVSTEGRWLDRSGWENTIFSPEKEEQKLPPLSHLLIVRKKKGE